MRTLERLFGPLQLCLWEVPLSQLPRPGFCARPGSVPGSGSADLSVYRGRRIERATLVRDRLGLVFGDRTVLNLVDDSRECCARHGLRLESPLESLIGSRFVGARILGGMTPVLCDLIHDRIDLVLTTDRGHTLVRNHGEVV